MGWGYSQLGFTEMVDSSAFPSRNGISRDGVSDDIDSTTSANRGSRSDEEGGGARSMAIRMAEKTSSFLNNTIVSSKDAFSDIRTAVYSQASHGLHRYGWIRTEEEKEHDRTDIDRSTHSLTKNSEYGNNSNSNSRNFKSSRNDMERGGYEPPSPLYAPPSPPVTGAIDISEEDDEEEVVLFTKD
jgi:hypothetical protein